MKSRQILLIYPFMGVKLNDFSRIVELTVNVLSLLLNGYDSDEFLRRVPNTKWFQTFLVRL